MKTISVLNELEWVTSGEPVSGDVRSSDRVTAEGVANRAPKQLYTLFRSILPLFGADLSNFRVKSIDSQEKIDLSYNVNVILPAKSGAYSAFTISDQNVKPGYVTNQTNSNVVITDVYVQNTNTKSTLTLAPGECAYIDPFKPSSDVLAFKATASDKILGSNSGMLDTIPKPYDLPKGITVWGTTRCAELSDVSSGTLARDKGIVIGISSGTTTNPESQFSAMLIGINHLGTITIRSSANGSSKNNTVQDDNIIDSSVSGINAAKAQKDNHVWQARYYLNATTQATPDKEGVTFIYKEGKAVKDNTVIGAQYFLSVIESLKSLTSTVEDTRYGISISSDISSKASNIDPNTCKESLVLTIHRNCPDSNNIYWISTFFNANKRLRWQTATQANQTNRNGSTLLYARTALGTEGSNTFWTPWTKVNTPFLVDSQANNRLTGTNTFDDIRVLGKKSQTGAQHNTEVNSDAPYYASYENGELQNSNSSTVVPLTRLKVGSTAFSTGVVTSNNNNVSNLNIEYGYASLVSGTGTKVWKFSKTGDFISTNGDIVNSDGTRLSDALTYNKSGENVTPTNLKNGLYYLDRTTSNALLSKFQTEANNALFNMLSTPNAANDYTMLQMNTPVQDTSFIVGGVGEIYVRINEVGNNGRGSQDSIWTQLITTANKASTTVPGIVQLSSSLTSKEETLAASAKAIALLNESMVELGKKVDKGGVAVGTIVAFPRSVRPKGFLLANGTRFVPSTYPQLYEVLGTDLLPKLDRNDIGMTAYFPTDDDIPSGWIPFDEIATQVNEQRYPNLYNHLIHKYGSIANVPKVADRFLRNAGNGLLVGQTQEDEFKRHVHRHIENNTAQHPSFYNDKTFDYSSRDATDRASLDIATALVDNNDDNWWITPNIGSKFATGGDETRPKSLVLKLCIKALDSFGDVRFWIKSHGDVINVGSLDASRLAQDLQGKADREHKHTIEDITGLREYVKSVMTDGYTYIKTGDFEIYKFPDGTMIQTCLYRRGSIEYNKNFSDNEPMTIPYPLSFVGNPAVSVMPQLSHPYFRITSTNYSGGFHRHQTETVGETTNDKTQRLGSPYYEANDGIVALTIDNDNNQCQFVYSNGNAYISEMTFHITAIGRWKSVISIR